MTHAELAAEITGNEIGKEISKNLQQQAKENNLVVIFGASDDLK